jgi:hypothetical protein
LISEPIDDKILLKRPHASFLKSLHYIVLREAFVEDLLERLKEVCGVRWEVQYQDIVLEAVLVHLEIVRGL